MRRRLHLLMGATVAGVGAVLLLSATSLSSGPDTDPSMETASAPALQDARVDERAVPSSGLPVEQTEDIRTVNLTLKPGDTLLGVLAKAGVPDSEAYAVSERLREMVDLRALKAGQNLELSLRGGFEDGDEANLDGLALVQETDRLVVAQRTDGRSFNAHVRQIDHSSDLMSATGSIATSLYEAARDQGVPMSVLLQTYDVLGHAVDFQRDIKEGDRFELGYERFDDGGYGGQHPGKLVYVSLALAERTLIYFRYTTSDGITGYFDAGGSSVQTSLLKTPVDGGRLSSLFGKREHPILGYTRMHKGLDFAAPRGTPILAAGDGVITRRGDNGSFGNYLRVRHDNRYATAYAHLIRYAEKLSVGSRVRQGDVIGYVGATGLATGPNLHYEVLRNGEQVNPVEVDLPPRRVLAGDELTRFRKAANTLLSTLSLSASESNLSGTSDLPG